MTKRSKLTEQDVQAGEQGDLIDVQPENIKEIVKQARLYKRLQVKRIDMLTDEVVAKKTLLSMLEAEKIERIDGKIVLKCNGMTITVSPRDELIKVKDDADDGE
jgi:hypothetical protein